MLKALVICPNERTREILDIIQIAKIESKRKEHSDKSPRIKNVIFDPVTGVWLAIYEVVVQKPRGGHRGAHG